MRCRKLTSGPCSEPGLLLSKVEVFEGELVSVGGAKTWGLVKNV